MGGRQGAKQKACNQLQEGRVLRRRGLAAAYLADTLTRGRRHPPSGHGSGHRILFVGRDAGNAMVMLEIRTKTGQNHNGFAPGFCPFQPDGFPSGRQA